MHMFEVKGLDDIYPLHRTPPPACSSEEETSFRRQSCDPSRGFSAPVNAQARSEGFHTRLPSCPWEISVSGSQFPVNELGRFVYF